jgi:hypothetical protein
MRELEAAFAAREELDAAFLQQHVFAARHLRPPALRWFVRSLLLELLALRWEIRGEVDGFTAFTIPPGVANCLAGFDAFFGGMSFDEFVDAVAGIPDDRSEAHFRSQHCFVCDDDGQLAVDFVCRYERLADDLRQVSKRSACQRSSCPRCKRHASRRTTPRSTPPRPGRSSPSATAMTSSCSAMRSRRLEHRRAAAPRSSATAAARSRRRAGPP